MLRYRVTFIVIVALAASACSGRPGVQRPSPSSRIVTGADVLAIGGYSAYDGLVLLRLRGMNTRNLSTLTPSGRSQLVVYLDGVRLSSIETLRDIHPLEVASMDAPTATIRFGTGHTGGAIVVTTGRGLRGAGR
jgi:hypothetical protein